MGEHRVNSIDHKETRAQFLRFLLNDVKALELMLQRDLIEKGITRIGSEQEFCLINKFWRPSRMSMEILERINDPHFTTELARYNLEINLDPVELKQDAFTRVGHQLESLLKKAQNVANEFDQKIILTGILPTISKSQVEFDYMTPNPRYWEINQRMRAMRGTDFELNIRGVDELTIRHDSVLFEACNTSFQLHLQVDPDDFISSYNWSQAISGPVLGISANSPLLLGRELWSETRIALFQQSIDTRSSSYSLKDQQARVTFGIDWASGSVVDIFKNDIARYKVLLSTGIESDALEILEKGGIPKLQALNLHNGTIWKWNRPCYGVGGGKPHLRIENRYIPSGPSIPDEMANFAFWVGLMTGRPAHFDDLPSVMDFKDAKANFIKAARTGKESVVVWNNSLISVRDLVTKELLPMAWSGLKKHGIDQQDADRLLTILEKRAVGFIGAQWKTRNYRKLLKSLKQDDALRVLTKSIYENQQEGLPVNSWEDINDQTEPDINAEQISHIMSSQLLTVKENDLAELAASIMQWKNIHHLPVEDETGKLCGILTWTHIQEFEKQRLSSSDSTLSVADIMVKQVITCPPEMKISEAIDLMKEHAIGCLPIVEKEQLIGIVTKNDVLNFGNN